MSGEVTVRTYRRARHIIGEKELTRKIEPNADVRGLLDDLSASYDLNPEECIVMVNGRNINQLDGRLTSLSNGDLVVIAVDPSPD